jgi:hypothetical protein
VRGVKVKHKVMFPIIEKELLVSEEFNVFSEELEKMIMLIKMQDYIVDVRLRIGKESAIEYTIKTLESWLMCFRFHFDDGMNLTYVKIMPYGASHDVMRRIKMKLTQEINIQMQLDVNGTFVSSDKIRGMLAIMKATTISF